MFGIYREGLEAGDAEKGLEGTEKDWSELEGVKIP